MMATMEAIILSEIHQDQTPSPVEMLGHVVNFGSQEHQSRRSSVTCIRRNTPGDTAEGAVEESTSTR
jgi:hypothetical protein